MPVDVVKRLSRPLYGSGRNITADNWFTDITLVGELDEKNLSYVGTIRKNRRQLSLLPKAKKCIQTLSSSARTAL